MGSNRTFMELKSSYVRSSKKRIDTSSNRTFMELKLLSPHNWLRYNIAVLIVPLWN